MYSSHIHKIILCAIFSVAMSLHAASSRADSHVGPVHETGDTYSARVSFADLDLTRREGAQTLFSRLDTASRLVCSVDMDDTRNFDLAAWRRRCYTDALRDAVKKLNNVFVTELYLRHTGQSIGQQAVAELP